MSEKLIETLAQTLPWSEPRELACKDGVRRILRKCKPPEWWNDYWAMNSRDLYPCGIRNGKDLRTGSPEIVWWQNLPGEEQEKREANRIASRAATTDFDPPRPEGLNYLPFQKAGIEFALRIWGDL